MPTEPGQPMCLMNDLQLCDRQLPQLAPASALGASSGPSCRSASASSGSSSAPWRHPPSAWHTQEPETTRQQFWSSQNLFLTIIHLYTKIELFIWHTGSKKEAPFNINPPPLCMATHSYTYTTYQSIQHLILILLPPVQGHTFIHIHNLSINSTFNINPPPVHGHTFIHIHNLSINSTFNINPPPPPPPPPPCRATHSYTYTAYQSIQHLILILPPVQGHTFIHIHNLSINI